MRGDCQPEVPSRRPEPPRPVTAHDVEHPTVDEELISVAMDRDDVMLAEDQSLRDGEELGDFL